MEAINDLSVEVVDQGYTDLHLRITPPSEDPNEYDGYNVRVLLGGGLNSPVLQAFQVDKSACPDAWVRGLDPNTAYDVEIEWYSATGTNQPVTTSTSTCKGISLSLSYFYVIWFIPTINIL